MLEVASRNTVGRMRVLLIGASGQFGSKLARLLAQENSIALVLAGRRQDPLAEMQRTLGGGEILVLDRESITAGVLREHGIDVVADLSGPYHEMHSTVVRAAIDAGVHYIDIADSRNYVNGVRQLDNSAKLARCAVLTGASSTPALSHAVIDDLTNSWQRIDSIEATISPSNSQEYGLSVIRGMLDQVGKSMTIFMGGDWRTVPFWSDTKRRFLPDVGSRYTSLVETPDNDLFVSRYRPVQSAQFRASLELAVMHLGVSALSRLVHFRLLTSAGWLASPLHWIANRMSRLSSQYGGMVIIVKGRNQEGDGLLAEWSLTAKGAAGPHVPVLACLILIRRISRNLSAITGAHTCAGLVSLPEFDTEFRKLGIHTQKRVSRLAEPPFKIALGDQYATLPAITRAVHTTNPSRLLAGEVTIEGATNVVAKMVARLFRMPASSPAARLITTIEMDESGIEHWARHFPDRCMQSRMGNPDGQAQTIDENFGPFSFTLKLTAHADGIDMHLIAGRVFGVSLPRFCLPDITATERADQNKHLFDIDLLLPLVGRLVHYKGWLEVSD